MRFLPGDSISNNASNYYGINFPASNFILSRTGAPWSLVHEYMYMHDVLFVLYSCAFYCGGLVKLGFNFKAVVWTMYRVYYCLFLQAEIEKNFKPLYGSLQKCRYALCLEIDLPYFSHP